jgi:hypothetical protein
MVAQSATTMEAAFRLPLCPVRVVCLAKRNPSLASHAARQAARYLNQKPGLAGRLIP